MEKYYWLLEVNPMDWDTTDGLIEDGAIHISTISMGDQHIRRYVKKLTEQEVVVLKLQYGHRISIDILSSRERAMLIDRGYLDQ
jgi:hypothetical protein